MASLPFPVAACPRTSIPPSPAASLPWWRLPPHHCHTHAAPFSLFSTDNTEAACAAVAQSSGRVVAAAAVAAAVVGWHACATNWRLHCCSAKTPSAAAAPHGRQPGGGGRRVASGASTAALSCLLKRFTTEHIDRSSRQGPAACERARGVSSRAAWPPGSAQGVLACCSAMAPGQQAIHRAACCRSRRRRRLLSLPPHCPMQQARGHCCIAVFASLLSDAAPRDLSSFMT